MSFRPDHSFMGSAKQDGRDVRLCDSETIGYIGLRHRASKFSDFGNFFLGKKLLEESDSPNVDRMLPVELVSGPFKISSDIVGFDTINMVDHRKVGWVRYESESHKSVNVDRLAFPISEKIDVLVTEFVSAGTKDLSVYSARLQAVADAVKASHSTKITDLVEISEVCDRNRSPFFCDDDIHSTGCPSGEVGLAIKSPSYVRACGGLAFMAPASTTFNTLQ